MSNAHGGKRNGAGMKADAVTGPMTERRFQCDDDRWEYCKAQGNASEFLRGLIDSHIGEDKTYFVVYSPRGFSNELSVAVFGSHAQAKEFREEIDNDVNCFTVPAGGADHRREVAAYKSETEQHYHCTPLERYLEELKS